MFIWFQNKMKIKTCVVANDGAISSDGRLCCSICICLENNSNNNTSLRSQKLKIFYAKKIGRDHHVEEPIGLIRQIWKLVYLFLPVGIKKEIHNKSHSLNQIG